MAQSCISLMANLLFCANTYLDVANLRGQDKPRLMLCFLSSNPIIRQQNMYLDNIIITNAMTVQKHLICL